MHTRLLLVLLLLVVAIVMFVINRPRMDAVAIIVLVALPLTGVVTMGESLSGFADPNVILIGAMFVLCEGLVRTGVACTIGDWPNRSSRGSDTQLLVLLMLAVAALGSVASSTAVVEIFIPIVLRISQNTGTPPSRLMMPLSFAALISCMLPVVATAPNLVVDAEVERAGLSGFGFFSVTPFRIVVLIVGIPYMVVTRCWLAVREAKGEARSPRGAHGNRLGRRPAHRYAGRE